MNVARSQALLEIRERDLPYSKMVFPEKFRDRLKYGFWRLYTPLHPFTRDFALTLRIVAPPARRQNFLIGKLRPEMTLGDMVKYLVSQGYKNHFIAWKDDGEVVSLRKVVSFERQYHIRVFADGEIRGHYEYTPECYPILHYKAVSVEARRDEFLKLLENKIV